MADSPLNNTNFYITTQYLLERKKQSLLAILGVVFGTATFIVLLSFMTGVNDFLDDAVFKGNPDLVIGPDTALKDSGETSRTVQPLTATREITKYIIEKQNTGALAEQLLVPGIIVGSARNLPVQVNGIYPEQEQKMVSLEDRLIDGNSFESLKVDDGILLGISLANELNASVGDSFRLILPNGQSLSLQVSGIFSFGISTIDKIRAYVHIEALRPYLGTSDLVSHLHVKLVDRDDLGLKDQLLHLRSDLVVDDWKENNKTIVVGNKVRDVLTWSVSFALLLVAGFGIFNILNSTVMQKRKDIAVLKTMGYRTKDINLIFLMKSLFIGSIGSLIGSVLGLVLSYFISVTPLDTTDFIIVSTYPVNFEPIYYITAVTFGIITSGLAGYWPSKKASKLDPAKVIRDI